MTRRLLLTLDVDWAPDWMIDEVAGILIRHGVKATWFATHRSPAVERLLERPELFEVGLHPNFMPGSSHGANPDQVLSHLRDLFPEATSMRTHGLHQSTWLLRKAATEYGMLADASLLLPGARHLAPHVLPFGKGSLLRFPCTWEDDVEMLQPAPCWDLDQRFSGPGLVILAFHPVHVVLNSTDPERYCALKQDNAALQETIRVQFPPTNETTGTRDLFKAACRALQGAGSTVRELTWEMITN